MSRNRSPGGFSFIELIVALAILVMVAAVVTPAIVGTLDRARVDSSQKTLDAMQQGMLDFVADVNRFPGELSQLTTPITGSQVSSCGSTFPTGLANQWAGPYMTRAVQPSGLPLPIGSVQNTLVRTPASSSRAVITINVAGVTLEDATRLNNSLDMDGSGTLGTVQWTASGSDGMVTLHYTMNVNQC